MSETAPRRRTAGTVLVVATATLVAAASLAGDEPKPWDLGVRVVVAVDAAGSDQFAHDLEVVLVDELLQQDCYRSVRIVEDDTREPGQLVLKVRVDEVDKRTEHELSLAARELSDQPEDKTRYRIEVFVRAEVGLLAPGSDRAVMSRPYRLQLSARPRFSGDDPEEQLRGEVLDDFAERVSRIACKPGVQRLERWIREANAEASTR